MDAVVCPVRRARGWHRRREGRVQRHRQLLGEVWGPNNPEHSRYLRICLGHLRKKLEVDPARPAHFLTETGVGYRFVAQPMPGSLTAQ